MKHLSKFTLLVMFFTLAVSGFSQTHTSSPTDGVIYQEPIKLAGPRFGVTGVSGNMAKYLEANGLSPFMSQFGWQFETRYFQTKSGYQGLFEFVPLIAGLESGQSALSMNLLAGFRTPRGFEIGVGPNFGVRGLFGGNPTTTTAMVYAVGHSFRVDEVNIPVNVAFSPSANGSSITALVGFNIQQRSID